MSTDVHPVIVPDLAAQANSALLCCDFRGSLKKRVRTKSFWTPLLLNNDISLFVSIFSACSVFPQGYFITLLRLLQEMCHFDGFCGNSSVYQVVYLGRNASLLSLLFLCHVFVGPGVELDESIHNRMTRCYQRSHFTGTLTLRGNEKQRVLSVCPRCRPSEPFITGES